MSDELNKQYGRLIIVSDDGKYDLTLYSSGPLHFYLAEHVDQRIQELGAANKELLKALLAKKGQA